jgi:hypothetical protein
VIVKEGVYKPHDLREPWIVVIKVDRMYGMVTWRWQDETREREMSRMNFEANLIGAGYTYDMDQTVRMLNART